MLKCLILPLIVSSMISAIGSLDLSVSGRIGTRAIVYYMTTTVSAVILGIILVLTIHPGEGSDKGIVRGGSVRHVTTADMLMDLIRSASDPLSSLKFDLLINSLMIFDPQEFVPTEFSASLHRSG